MSKRVQPHPVTAKSSLFHQVLINTMVVYALREVQKPYSWLIQSLNPDPKPNKQKKGKQKGFLHRNRLFQLIKPSLKRKSLTSW
jgi:hypothetical protein